MHRQPKLSRHRSGLEGVSFEGQAYDKLDIGRRGKDKDDPAACHEIQNETDSPYDGRERHAEYRQ